jgi:serum/glucocorticoid-regulated kinase 2
MNKQAKVHDNEKPQDWSAQAVDFVNQLLLRKQHQRLGHDTPGSAKAHPWFDNFDWNTFENFGLPSPFSGIVKYNFILFLVIIES